MSVGSSEAPYLPRLALCAYWIALSKSELVALNISTELAQVPPPCPPFGLPCSLLRGAQVLQWRIEQPYSVGFARSNVAGPKMARLLNATRPEYEALMATWGLRRFDDLMARLIPKNYQPDIIMKTKSGSVDNDHWAHHSRPDVLTYAKACRFTYLQGPNARQRTIDRTTWTFSTSTARSSS